MRHFPGNRKSNESPNTPWDCHHICRSIGMVLGGQWGGIYGSPMERLESDKWSKNQKKNIIIPSVHPGLLIQGRRRSEREALRKKVLRMAQTWSHRWNPIKVKASKKLHTLFRQVIASCQPSYCHCSCQVGHCPVVKKKFHSATL